MNSKHNLWSSLQQESETSSKDDKTPLSVSCSSRMVPNTSMILKGRLRRASSDVTESSPSSPSMMSETSSNQKRISRRYIHRVQSEAKLRELLGPVSFSLNEPPTPKISRGRVKLAALSREPSESKLRELLGPVSFSLDTKQKRKARRHSSFLWRESIYIKSIWQQKHEITWWLQLLWVSPARLIIQHLRLWAKATRDSFHDIENIDIII